MLGAKVSKFSILSREPQYKDLIEIIQFEENEYLNSFHGKYLREGEFIEFDQSDLQSFTLLRFLPPELMDYKGKALVIDPDVFLVRPNLDKLFEMDMNGSSIACKKGGKNILDWATSVMLLDCSKLNHWKLDQFIANMKKGDLDYRDLMSLNKEGNNIKELDESWNDYDRINSKTTFLHTTQRVTQPWKKGLEIDTYLKPVKPILGFIPRRKVHRILKKPLSDMYVGHPDKEVNKFFFSELSAAITQGFISADEIRSEIKKENIRKDIFSLLTLNET